MTDQEILTKLAGDVGYIRAVAEQLDEAKLPERVTRLEVTQTAQAQQIHLIQTRREKVVAKSVIGATAFATVATAAAAVVALVVH